MSYFESRLKVNIDNLDEIERTLGFCKELGIQNVILESKKRNHIFNSKLKTRIIKISSFNIYFRNNIVPENLNDFKRKVSEFSNSHDIISVESLDKKIQIQAAKDSRVDLISYSSVDILKSISPGVISLTKQNSSFIEFSLAPIFMENKAIQSKNLRNLYRGIHLAERLKANYIISGNFHEIFDFRHPRGLISICNTLLGLPIQNAKKAFKYNVNLLIKRNADRSNENIYDRGVELIKEREE